MAQIDKEKLMTQAQNIWTMLDDMAENDPQAYRKFIDKQMNDGREYMRLPDPHMCVRTSYVDKSTKDRGTLYINVCEWARVPKPTDDTSPIPVIGGVMGKLEDKGEVCKIVSLGFNPKVLEDYGMNASNLEEQQSLIHLAVDYVKDHYKLELPYSYVLLPKDTKHKGTVQMLRDSLKTNVRKEDEAYEKQMKDLSETFAPLSGKNVESDSLLTQLSNVTIHSDNSKTNSDTPIPNLSMFENQEAKSKQKNLIQEIGSVENEECMKPGFCMTVRDAEECKPRRIVVKISLPKVSSVSECLLDVDQKKLHLSVPDKYDDLEVTFTESVISDSSSAKFSKKTCSLTVVIPTTQT